MADLRSGAQALPQVPRVAMSAEAVATDINRQGTAIGNTQVAQNRSLPPEEWTGAAADAASSEIQKLGEKTVTLSEAFSPAAAALNDWASAVNSAISDVTGMQNDWDKAVRDYNQAIEEADAAYEAHGSPLDAQLYGGGSDWYRDSNGGWGSRSYDRNKAYEDASGVLTTAQNNIRERYVKRLNELDDAAQTAADNINAAREPIVSDEAGAGGRSVVGVNLFGSDTPLLAGAEQWEDAQVQAEQMAEVLKKQPMTTQDIMTFNEKWGDLLGNPFYAYALKQRVSTDEIYAAVLNAGMLASDDANHPSYTFNKNLGTALALATGGANLSDSNRDNQKIFDSVSSGLVGENGLRIDQTTLRTLDELKETGRKQFTLPVYNAPEFTMDGYDIAGQIMGLAGRENTSLTLGPGFYEDPRFDPILGEKVHVKSVFQDMVAWDYEVGAGSRATDYAGSGPAWRAHLIPHEYGNREALGYLDPLQNIFTLSDTPDSLHGKDDGSVLWKAENQRLAALRWVLNSDTPFEISADYDGDNKATTEHMNMTRYLTGWRGYAAVGTVGYYDGGEALGDMVNDASKRTPTPVVVPDEADLEKYPQGASDPAYQRDYKHYQEWLDDDKQRAQVAQNILLGYQDGLNHSGDTTALGEDIFGNNNPKLRSWIGTIAAGRVDDLAAMANNADGGMQDTANSQGKSGYSMMNMTDRQVQSLFSSKGLLTDLAFDKPVQIKAGDDLDPSNYEGGRLPALKAIGTQAWYQYRLDAETLAKGPYDAAEPGEGDLSGATWRQHLKVGTSGWQNLITAVDKAPGNAGVRVDQAEIERNKEIRAAIDYAVSKVPVGKLPGGDIFADGVSSFFKDPLYSKYLSTDSDPALVTQRVQQELKTTQGLQYPAISAFMERDNWPNAQGLSKEEILRNFAKTQGWDPEAKVPTYAEMSSDQRSALYTYLTDIPTGATAPRTDLAYLKSDLNDAVNHAEDFVTRCDQKLADPSHS